MNKFTFNICWKPVDPRDPKPLFPSILNMMEVLVPCAEWRGEWQPELSNARLILGLCPANERRHYKITPSLIGWAQT